MRRYEMLLMVSDALEEDDAVKVVEGVKTLIDGFGGRTVGDNFWGHRQLAYEINHRTAAYYAVLDFELGGESRPELERQLKLNDDVMRFKLVRPDLRIRQGA